MKKAPWPLRLLSYLVEIPVSKHSSQYSPQLKLSLYQGRYMLSVNQVVYSFEDKYSSFSKALQHIKGHIPQVQHLLVLGYGLGSIPAILYKQHGVTPHITAVDVDPVILQLAQEYSPLPENAEVDYIAQDAMNFMESNQKLYDLITIDLFIDDEVPLPFRSPEFISKLTDRLSPGGMVLFSWLYSDAHLKQATDTYYQEVFAQTLPGAFTIETGGNLVLGWKKNS